MATPPAKGKKGCAMVKKELYPGAEKLSLLGLGCMRLPLDGDGKIDERKASEIVDAAMENGINYYDTAFFYHEEASEPFLGRALAKYPRDSYYLATKLPTPDVYTNADVDRFFEEQLARCATDYFDFYLLHNLNGARWQRMKDLGVYEQLNQRRKAGQIKRLGFSFHDSPEVLEQICSDKKWDMAQIQLNYYDWESYRSREQYEVLEKHRIPCVVMEPLRGGWLAELCPEATQVLKAARPEDSVASWGLRFAASLPGVVTVLSGMSTLEQLRDNLETFESFTPLTVDDRDTLAQALEIVCRNTYVPCTGCQYCMPCPFGVNIPAMFAFYNQRASDDSMDLFEDFYQYQAEEQRAENCTGCGRCVELCPQHIDIPHVMQGVVQRTKPGQLKDIRTQ